SFFYSSTHPPLLPPFPTRRSSDLLRSSRTTRISKCSGVSFGNSSIARDARRRAVGPPDPLEKWGLRLPKRPPISSGTSGRLRRLAHPTPLQSAEDSMQVSRREFLRLTANAGAGTAIGGMVGRGAAVAAATARAQGRRVKDGESTPAIRPSRSGGRAPLI